MNLSNFIPRHINENKFKANQIYLYFLFIIIIILTLNPFFKIGFTTGDDLEYYLSVLRGCVFEDAEKYAKHAGRFYFLITKPLYHIPYIIDNFYFTKIVQYSSLILSFILFALVVKKIFKQKYFALLVFLILFAFLTITPNFHIPILAYPFFFTFSFSILLFSILRFIKYIETNKNKFLIQSVILFAIVLLFYETYLIFLIFFCAFIFIRNIIIYKKDIFKVKCFYKEIIPFIMIAIAYVSIYFGYREFVLSNNEFYYGSSFANDFNLKNIFKILVNYNNAAYPKFVYNTHQPIIEANSILESGHQKGFLYILAHSQVSVIVNALIQCFVFILLFSKMKPDIPWKKIGLGILISLLLMFSVHFLISISEKYSSGYWLKVIGYVTTYYSYFFIAIILCLVMYSLFKICYKKLWLRAAPIGVFSLLVFYLSIVIGYSNEHMSRDWERNHNQFMIMDEFCNEGIFNVIPQNSIIFAEDLYKSSSLMGDISSQNFKWDEWVFLKTGKEIRFCKDSKEFISEIEKNKQQNIYYMAKYETIKNTDVLYVLTKINQASIDYSTPENMFLNANGNFANVYYYSVNKDFNFEFIIPESNELPIVTINDHEQITGDFGINIISVNNKNKTDKITSIKIHSTEPFYANRFLLSTIGNINSSNSVITLQ